MKVTLVAQGTDEGTLEAALKEAAEGGNFDRLDVAVAYATKQGILTLEAALGGFPPKSRWVVGLDDAITQPEALDHLLAVPGAKVRLASLAPQRRFHPKLYCMRRSDDDAARISVIGSGNMTLRGLRHNGEVAALVAAESAADAEALKGQWNVLWSLGEKATQPKLDAYAASYLKAKKERKKIAALGVAPPEPEPEAPVPDVLDGNFATAAHAWLEVGKATQGKEVEIPKPLLPFFRLPAGQASAILQFRLPSGASRPLRLIDRKGNSMWRIEFTAEVIQAIASRSSFYRPDGNKRSELVLAFKHVPGQSDLRVRTVNLGGADYNALHARSNSVGAARRTRRDVSGRSYGVY